MSRKVPQFPVEERNSISSVVRSDDRIEPINIHDDTKDIFDTSLIVNQEITPPSNPRISTITRRVDDTYSEYYYSDDYYYDDEQYDEDFVSIDKRQGSTNIFNQLMLKSKEKANEAKQTQSSSNVVNTIKVLDMINSLQQEIKEINSEIEKENSKIQQLRSKKPVDTDDEMNEPVINAAKLSTEETVKELTLQKEDTTMKKVMAQMMLMKKIQKKKEENKQLELALRKLAERRKLINAALKKQKQIAAEKRFEAQREIQRQKQLMKEREELIIELKAQEDKQVIQSEIQESKKENNRKLLILNKLRKQNPQLGKLQLLEAHKSLVDQSNDRILAKIEELKLEREKTALSEQEKLIEEQNEAIAVLQKLKNNRLRLLL